MDPPDGALAALSLGRSPPSSEAERPDSVLGASTSSTAAAGGDPSPSAQLDMSMSSAVSALVHHLVQPLSVHYAHTQLMALRARLTAALERAFAPTWTESNPHIGSGARSLISNRTRGLPRVLLQVAGDVDPATWARAIRESRRRKPAAPSANPATAVGDDDEWEAWCDPGLVVWRWGTWGWDDAEFDPIKRQRESYHVVWQAAPSGPAPEATSPVATPVRASKAIPIRAPGLLAISASPSGAATPSLLPAADIMAHPHPTVVTDANANAHTAALTRRRRGRDSTSSSGSDTTSNEHTQLLTPMSRPGSADLFPDDAVKAKHEHVDGEPDASGPAEPRSPSQSPPHSRPHSRSHNRTPSPARSGAATPTVTPYDGGNVTVLGGGTKLGGSRPASVRGDRDRCVSGERDGERTRSPSVSIATRALATAVGANSNTAGTAPLRKQRARRRIIPTHIGYFGQSGVGAPMMGSFGTKPYAWPHGQPGGPPLGPAGGVGVGLAPPPAPMVIKRM